MLRKLLVLTAATLSPQVAAQTHPIADPAGAGRTVVVNTDQPIIATYLGTSAAYSDDLYLGDQLIFNNQESALGATFNLGTFTPGTELIFQLRVRNTGNIFRTGSGGRNPDGLTHATVEDDYLVPGTTLVSFEDLSGGPLDYNDLSFSFAGTIGGGVPEPASWALMIVGFGAVGGSLRRRSAVRTTVRFA